MEIPDYIYAEAWRTLYTWFGEMQQDELDLMDTVLANVIAEEKDDKSRHLLDRNTSNY